MSFTDKEIEKND